MGYGGLQLDEIILKRLQRNTLWCRQENISSSRSQVVLAKLSFHAFGEREMTCTNVDERQQGNEPLQRLHLVDDELVDRQTPDVVQRHFYTLELAAATATTTPPTTSPSSTTTATATSTTTIQTIRCAAQ